MAPVPAVEAGPELADRLPDALRLVIAPDVVGRDRACLVEVAAGCERPGVLNCHKRGLLRAPGRFGLLEGLCCGLWEPEPGGGNCPVAGDLGCVHAEDPRPHGIAAVAGVRVPLGIIKC